MFRVRHRLSLKSPGGRLNFFRCNEKKFYFFDVTEAIKAWLDNPDSNFGFAVVTSDASMLIGSKEGTGTGHPAELEIEINTVLPLFSGGDVSSGLIVGSAIAPGTIGSLQLGLQSVLPGNLGVGSVTTSAIAGDAIDGSKVVNGSLTGLDFLDASIPAGKLKFEGAIFWDQKARDESDGAAISNGWQRRTLNAEKNLSDGSISRTGDTITLQPGTYYVRDPCPATDSSSGVTRCHWSGAGSCDPRHQRIPKYSHVPWLPHPITNRGLLDS
jgi:hypothetical protein